MADPLLSRQCRLPPDCMPPIDNLISIIIPVYNRAEYLAEAIASVRRQTYKQWELLIIDDGSTNPPLTGIQQNTFYIYTKHRGVAAARNLGARFSRGNWLAFLDSDDLWQPRKLERQVECITDSVTLIYTDEEWRFQGNHKNQGNRHRKYSNRMFKKAADLCLISPSSVLLRKDIFTRFGGFDPLFPVCEDYDLWLRWTNAHPVLFLKEKLIIKRGGHEGQLSRSTWGFDRFRVRALKKILPELSGPAAAAAAAHLREKTVVLLTGSLKNRNRGLTTECLTDLCLLAGYRDTGEFRAMIDRCRTVEPELIMMLAENRIPFRALHLLSYVPAPVRARLAEYSLRRRLTCSENQRLAETLFDYKQSITLDSITALLEKNISKRELFLFLADHCHRPQ